MKNNYLISCKEDYVEATSDGPMTLNCMIQLWSKIIHTCKECTCTKILNISNSVTPITVSEAINHLKSFEHLGITNDYRVALVELNPVCGESSLLVESLLSSYGMDIRSFLDIEDAKSWLFFGRKI
ncbi:MAG: hypothetical protein GQ549_08315 [Gammaproteobacteria bacterium]|nr:hypothetical protein [Gammaproteobacteria bacterium]